MLVWCGLRTAVKAISITDPIGSVDIYATPLMGPLILVDMLIRDTKDIQAQTSSACTSGTGR